MDEVARVVLALEEHDVAEEVMHFLDRTGRARVVATANEPNQLSAAVRQLEPDAVVAQPSLVGNGSINGTALIALDTRESVASLRAAIRAGARGFYLWPSERDEIAAAAARTLVATEDPTRTARVIGVWSPRGGAGTTFVATHLAAALARGHGNCILLDADLTFGDVAPALGVPIDAKTAGLAELLALGDEANPAHVRDAMFAHADGFGVLLAPSEVPGEVEAGALRKLSEVAAASCDALVIHLPRSIDERTRSLSAVCDLLAVVLTLDVVGFRAARRATPRLGVEPARCCYVVNRAARSEVTPSDVQKVFGSRPLGVLPRDSAVARAQDRGLLMPARSRMGRAFDRLAELLMGDG